MGGRTRIPAGVSLAEGNRAARPLWLTRYGARVCVGSRWLRRFWGPIAVCCFLVWGGTLVETCAWQVPPVVPQVDGEQRPEPRQRAVLIRFDHMITRYSEHFLQRKIELARADNADLIVIEISSPGGELVTTERIANMLLDIEWAQVVAYVPREAISGAAIMALACDEILMRPTAVIGDAGVITMDEGWQFRFAEEKLVSEFAVRVRTIAEAAGRSPALAEAMVDKDAVVYRVRHKHSGVERLMNDAEIAGSDEPDQWEKLSTVTETQVGRFLHLNGQRAVELELADDVVSGLDDVYARYGVPEPETVYRWTGVDTAAAILHHPAVTFLLLLIGLVALYVEFLSPGLGAGGMVCGICFALFFWSRFLGGTADWLEVVLFAAGVVLMLVELFVLPGFGVWGVSGMLLMAASIVFAGLDFLIPETTADWARLQSSVFMFMALSVVVIGAAVFVTRRLGSIPGLNRLTLEPPQGTGTSDRPVAENLAKTEMGTPVQVGDVGVAETPLRPAGVVLFHREPADVVTNGTYVEAGQTVQVIRIEGSRIVVRLGDAV